MAHFGSNFRSFFASSHGLFSVKKFWTDRFHAVERIPLSKNSPLVRPLVVAILTKCMI
jgi:hypothetical protein